MGVGKEGGGLGKQLWLKNMQFLKNEHTSSLDLGSVNIKLVTASMLAIFMAAL